MPALPNDDEVRAWANLEPGAHIAEPTRRAGIKALLARRDAAAAESDARAAASQNQVLSRNIYPHPDGQLVVSVVLIPTKKETP